MAKHYLAACNAQEVTKLAWSRYKSVRQREREAEAAEAAEAAVRRAAEKREAKAEADKEYQRQAKIEAERGEREAKLQQEFDAREESLARVRKEICEKAKVWSSANDTHPTSWVPSSSSTFEFRH